MVEPSIEAVRTCVACGYNLFGLGDEPRCPECGSRNIPDEFRRQVWELVDSGKCFFSGPLALFQKRLPGWWWALDRPGDLRKSLWFLVRNLCLAAVFAVAAWCAASSIAVEVTNHYTSYEVNDPLRKPVYEDDGMHYFGLDTSWMTRWKAPNWSQLVGQTRTWTVTTQSRVIVIPNWWAIPTALSYALWIILVWAVPLFVGLITQLRKGLPSFARPPLTVFAAGAYESHRAIYAGVAFAFVLGVLTVQVIMGTGSMTPLGMFSLLVVSLSVLVVLYGSMGWIGPLRSDYTKQLIRSPFHAGRVVIMYAIVFPPLIAAMLVKLVRLAIVAVFGEPVNV